MATPKELGFPEGSLIGAIVRKTSAFIVTGDTVLQPDDEPLVACKPDAIAKVESLLS